MQHAFPGPATGPRYGAPCHREDRSCAEIIAALQTRNFTSVEGRAIDQLEIRTFLHSGPSAAVYSAILHGDEPVAVKFLLPQANALERMRYLREYITGKLVSTTARQRMLHVLNEQYDGIVFYWMPRIQGCTLSELHADNKLSIPESALLWAANLLELLSHAHSQGVLHLDISPRNVMVENDQITMHCLGWGYAHILPRAREHFANFERRERELLESTVSNDRSAVSVAQPAPTSPYTAPEVMYSVVDGRPVDERADLFSLAATMAEMWGAVFNREAQIAAVGVLRKCWEAAGRKEPLPVSADLQSLEVYAKKGMMASKRTSLLCDMVRTQFGKEAVDHLEKVLRRALDPDPAKRYRSAKEMKADLMLCSASPRFTPMPGVDTLEVDIEKLNNCGLMLLRSELMKWVLQRDSFKTQQNVVITINSVDQTLNPDNLRMVSELLAVLSIKFQVRMRAGGGSIDLSRTELEDNVGEDRLRCALFFAASIQAHTHGIGRSLCQLLRQNRHCPVRELDLKGVRLTQDMFQNLMDYLEPSEAGVCPALDALLLCRTGPHNRARCIRLSTVIRHNHCLRLVRLDDNSIESDGAKLLARALHHSPSIVRFTALGNPLSATVAAPFAKAQVALLGRIVEVEWLAFNVDIQAPNFLGGFLVARMGSFGQRVVFAFRRPKRRNPKQPGAEAGMEYDDALTGLYCQGTKFQTGASVVEMQEIFSPSGNTSFKCDQVCTFSEGYMRKHYVPRAVQRFSRMPLPLCLIPVALQQQEETVLRTLPVLREFYDNLICLHAHPIHAALRYACLLDHVAQYHLMIREILKEEARLYKEIAAKLFSELPLRLFRDILQDEQIAGLTLDCWCYQIASEPRFQYLVDRLWRGPSHGWEDRALGVMGSNSSLGTLHHPNIRHLPTETMLKSVSVGTMRGVHRFVWSPRTAYYSLAACHALHIFILLAPLANSLEESVALRYFRKMLAFAYLGYTLVQMAGSRKIPRATMTIRSDSNIFASSHVTMIKRALETRVRLSDMYKKDMTRVYFHYAGNWIDLVVAAGLCMWTYLEFEEQEYGQGPSEYSVRVQAVTILLLWCRMLNVSIVVPRVYMILWRLAAIMKDVCCWALISAFFFPSFTIITFALAKEKNAECLDDLTNVSIAMLRAWFLEFNDVSICLQLHAQKDDYWDPLATFTFWHSVVGFTLMLMLVAIFVAGFTGTDPKLHGFVNLDRLEHVSECKRGSAWTSLPPPLNLLLIALVPWRLWTRFYTWSQQKSEEPQPDDNDEHPAEAERRSFGSNDEGSCDVIMEMGDSPTGSRSMARCVSTASTGKAVQRGAALNRTRDHCRAALAGDEVVLAYGNHSVLLQALRPEEQNHLRRILQSWVPHPEEMVFPHVESRPSFLDNGAVYPHPRYQQHLRVRGSVSSLDEVAGHKLVSNHPLNQNRMAKSLLQWSSSSVKLESQGSADQQEDFADAVAEVISGLSYDSRAHGMTGAHEGEDMLHRLQQLPIYDKAEFITWLQNFTHVDERGSSAVPWEAMRLSLRVFRQLEKPSFPFHTAKRLLGDVRGITNYGLSERVGHNEALSMRTLEHVSGPLAKFIDSQQLAMERLVDEVRELRSIIDSSASQPGNAAKGSTATDFNDHPPTSAGGLGHGQKEFGRSPAAKSNRFASFRAMSSGTSSAALKLAQLGVRSPSERLVADSRLADMMNSQGVDSLESPLESEEDPEESVFSRQRN